VLRAAEPWPSQPAHVAEPQQDPEQLEWHHHLTRFGEAEPGAIHHEDIADADSLGTGGIERRLCGLLLADETRDAAGEIVGADGLEALFSFSRRRQH
jgi:hypothetical protein